MIGIVGASGNDTTLLSALQEYLVGMRVPTTTRVGRLAFPMSHSIDF